ncbi:lin-28 [Pristionchus pacificus]|uniref:Lin-28 n=1 Tax=Pristionchus pacificus TaxID=54126 RepID=A0A2A6CCL6_PRIPA|nr:lin-28 [Pristionchus pacificus]|eukprot:PDM75934.1 lin-28 [Pristionchus pacificus]
MESKEESHQGDGNMDDNAPRYLGACKWFNVLKGFGFLLQDGSGEEIFVHQSELQMKGFRSLENGSRVSFSTRPGKKGIEAYNVRGEADGDELTGSSVRPLGKKKNSLIRCFKCGGYGNHVAAKCRKIQTDNKVCYECRSSDHLVGNCPLRSDLQKGMAQ